MKNVFLRVKLKSLAEESKIIRQEELQANKFKNYKLQDQLLRHRKDVVRTETRATLLAYQYLRNVPYSVCEISKSSNQPNWKRVKKMVEKYGFKKFDQEKFLSS